MTSSWPNRDAFGRTSRILPGDLDGIETAIRTLFGQITTSTEWTKLLRVIGTLSDDLEAAQVAVQDQTDPATATGVNLDWLGENVGRPRAGLSVDDDYRIAVIARGYALIGSGVVADVIAVLDILGQAAGSVVLEHWPAKISVYLGASGVSVSTLAVILAAVRDVVADGVGVISVSTGDRPADSVDAAASSLIEDPILGDSVSVSITDPGETAVTAYP
jgi:hypothetical protein